LSEDNCLVVGTRQKPMTQKKIDLLQSASMMDTQTLRNFHRNKQLIDLSQVPLEIATKVMESYESQTSKGREKLMNYFIVNRLKHLMEHIGEF